MQIAPPVHLRVQNSIGLLLLAIAASSLSNRRLTHAPKQTLVADLELVALLASAAVDSSPILSVRK